jgi:hypothetical protein
VNPGRQSTPPLLAAALLASALLLALCFAAPGRAPEASQDPPAARAELNAERAAAFATRTVYLHRRDGTRDRLTAEIADAPWKRLL